MESLAIDILKSLVGGVITGGAAWMAIRVHIAWLRADIERAHQRINIIEQKVR